MSGNLLEPLPPQIPDKMYFRIGETSRLVGVAAHVLRFWESEFPSIAPRKSGRGHRLYRHKDVELFLEIKRLLYDKRFTIEGARKSLRSRRGRGTGPQGAASQKPLFPAEEAKGGSGLAEIRKGLKEILRILK